jgi:hypothetical protein
MPAKNRRAKPFDCMRNYSTTCQSSHEKNETIPGFYSDKKKSAIREEICPSADADQASRSERDESSELINIGVHDKSIVDFAPLLFEAQSTTNARSIDQARLTFHSFALSL